MLGTQIKSISKNGTVKFFYSINSAAKELNITRTNISGVLSGRGKTAGGYKFCKVESSDYRFNPEYKDLNDNFKNTIKNILK